MSQTVPAETVNSQTFNFTSGIDLAGLSVQAYGLAQPQDHLNQTILQDDLDDPMTSNWTQEYNVSNAGFIEVSTNSPHSIDIDLYLIYDSNDNNIPEPSEIIATSTTPYACEYVSVILPDDGRYWVFVHGWSVPGGSSTFDCTVNIVHGTDLVVSNVPTGAILADTQYNFTVTYAAPDITGTYNGIIYIGPTNAPTALNVPVTTVIGKVPTADYLAVENASGLSGTHVEVPVNIINVSNGPVRGIRLRIDYNESVLNLTSISSSDLTMNWTQLQLDEEGHTMFIGTEYSGDAIPAGGSGTVVLLNFSVIGSLGDTSPMNLSLIELLSDPEGTVGTAPAKSGTFTVSKPGSIAGRITYACNGTEIAGVVVNLTKKGIVVDTTVTNETGYYTFTDVNPGSYFVNASKPQFYDNSTEVTVIPGETVDMMLWLKGDLNNDGVIADVGDVVLMLRASVGDIPGDERYDLNGNGVIADAGDVVLLLRASIGDIVLL